MYRNFEPPDEGSPAFTDARDFPFFSVTVSFDSLMIRLQ
jgi:hypothetical protein